jgi:hypothetical protein
MRIEYKKPSKNNELWLEFGRVNDGGWHDLLWYNDGDGEFMFWFNNFLKDIFKPNRYYLIRYKGLSLYLKG